METYTRNTEEESLIGETSRTIYPKAKLNVLCLGLHNRIRSCQRRNNVTTRKNHIVVVTKQDVIASKEVLLNIYLDNCLLLNNNN